MLHGKVMGWRRLLLGVLLLLASWPARLAVAAPQAPVAVRCTLLQCQQRALQRSPLLAAARLGIDQYQSKLREAHTAWYPKFEVGNFSTLLPELKPGRDGTTPLQDYDFTRLGPLLVNSVSLAQTLYTFGKLSTLQDMARQGIDIAAVTVRVAEDELRYQMSRAWWGLVLVAELRDMLDDGRRILEEQRHKLERARDEGDASFQQADLLKLHVFAADIEETLRRFERTRAQAEDGARLAMADTHDVPVEAAGELTAVVVPPIPMEAVETLALFNAPRLLAQRGGVQVRLLQIDLAKAQLWPDLVFVARLAYSYVPSREVSPDSLATNPSNSATSGVGVALRWSLDLFRQLERIDQARLDYRQAALQERGERDKLRAEVRQLYREMKDARAMIEVHEKAYKAARGWLSAETQAHDDGFQEFAEVLRAMESYSRRRMAFAQSIYDYNIAVAALSRAVGMDLTTAKVQP